jgi:predicted Zn-dependent protease
MNNKTFTFIQNLPKSAEEQEEDAVFIRAIRANEFAALGSLDVKRKCRMARNQKRHEAQAKREDAEAARKVKKLF